MTNYISIIKDRLQRAGGLFVFGDIGFCGSCSPPGGTGASSPFPADKHKAGSPEQIKAPGLASGVPEVIRTPDLPLRRSPRGAFLTPSKSLKSLDFTGFSEISLSINSRPKPANFPWFFAFLLAGYYDCTSTIFCTQYKREDWHSRLGGGIHADAIMDRIVHTAAWVYSGDIN
ncbi:MAG: hypothetical protein SO088_04495, partial [Ruminococcus callidus]|nr:hypothetical protein [Ruminococcus callidus]